MVKVPLATELNQLLDGAAVVVTTTGSQLVGRRFWLIARRTSWPSRTAFSSRRTAPRLCNQCSCQLVKSRPPNWANAAQSRSRWRSGIYDAHKSCADSAEKLPGRWPGRPCERSIMSCRSRRAREPL